MISRGIEKAATLLLVRDATEVAVPAIEVFMLERPSRGAFPGLHVFTGGKVDPEDAVCAGTLPQQGPDASVAAELLGMSDDPLAYWLAAVRECYEESGVLFASRGGSPLTAADIDVLARSRAEDFATLVGSLNLRLELSELHYFAHWITPEQAPRRFDTRFFVARMPAGQSAHHAEGETVSGCWLTPAEALARAERGDWNLIMPTLTSLRSLVPYPNTAALFDAVARFDHLPTYSEHFRREGMQPGINPAAR